MSTSLAWGQKPLCWLTVLFFFLAAAPAAQAQWAETLPGTPDARLYKTVIDPAGNVTVAGAFSGTLTLGATTLTSRGDRDLFVARRSAAGGWAWAVSGGGASRDTIYSLIQLPTGEVCVAGKAQGTGTFQDALGTTSLPGSKTFLATVSSGGHWTGVNGLVLTGASINCAALEPASGDVLVSGVYSAGATIGTQTIPGTVGGVFAGRLSAGGQWRWVEPVSCNTVALDEGRVSSDGNGGLILTGYTYDTVVFGALTRYSLYNSAFVAHLTASRTWQWAYLFSDAYGWLRFNDQTFDAAGNSYFTGEYGGYMTIGFTGRSTFTSSMFLSNQQMFILRINTQGIMDWDREQGGWGFAAGTSICVDNAGSVYVGGLYSDTTYFTPQLIPVGGGWDDGVVLRYDANTGTPQAVATFGGTGSDQASSMAINPANGHLVVGGRFDSPTLPLGSNTLTHTGGMGMFSSFVADFSTLLRPLGTAEDAAALARLSLSPNPAHGALWLTTPAITGATTTGTGTLLDGVGRVVRTFPLTGERTRLDIQGVAPGVYTVRVGARTRRLVVE